MYSQRAVAAAAVPAVVVVAVGVDRLQEVLKGPSVVAAVVQAEMALRHAAVVVEVDQLAVVLAE